MRKTINTTLKNGCIVDGYYDLTITNKMDIKFDLNVANEDHQGNIAGRAEVVINNGSFRIMLDAEGDDGSYFKGAIIITEDSFDASIDAFDDGKRESVEVDNIEDLIAVFTA